MAPGEVDAKKTIKNEAKIRTIDTAKTQTSSLCRAWWRMLRAKMYFSPLK